MTLSSIEIFLSIVVTIGLVDLSPSPSPRHETFVSFRFHSRLDQAAAGGRRIGAGIHMEK